MESQGPCAFCCLRCSVVEDLSPEFLSSETKTGIWGTFLAGWLLSSSLFLEKDSNKNKGSEASQKTIKNPESPLNKCPVCPRPHSLLQHLLSAYSMSVPVSWKNPDFLFQSVRFHPALVLALLQTQPHPVGSSEPQTRLT